MTTIPPIVAELEVAYAQQLLDQQRRIRRLESGLRQALAVLSQTFPSRGPSIDGLLTELEDILNGKPKKPSA